MWLFLTPVLNAQEVHVAVASNFTEAAKEIGKAFTKKTDYDVLFSFGSTGQLYAQISQSAPFDVFLAADQERPENAIRNHLAVEGTRFTYANGKLVLFSVDQTLIKNEDALINGNVTKISIANPLTAPYGVAALEIVKHLNLYDHIKHKIVYGNNIAQTYQFVHTENAELGFIALSQVISNQLGSRWIVPESLYSKISQDAVLLQYGANNPAAHAFLNFLQTTEALNIIKKFGYGINDNEKT